MLLTFVFVGLVIVAFVMAFIKRELQDVDHPSSMNTSELKSLLAAHKEMRKL